MREASKMVTKSRLKRRAATWVLGVALLLPSACGTARPGAPTEGQPVDAAAFHRPRTAAERALDHILELDRTDRKSVAFVLQRPGRNATDQQYARLFTPAFLKAVRTRERELVERDCGGDYVDGELCGLEYSPITCAQDVSDAGYWFYTYRAGPKDAVLTVIFGEYRENGEPMRGPLYRMTKDASGWRLDGVACEDRFNFPAP